MPIKTIINLTGLCERTIKGRIRYLYLKKFLYVKNSKFNIYKINKNKLKFDKHYILIPSIVVEQNSFTPIEKVMLGLFYNYTRKNKVFYGKFGTLSDLLGVTDRTVRNVIKKFKNLNLIEIKDDGILVVLDSLKEE